jgi:hypothetical protein
MARAADGPIARCGLRSARWGLAGGMLEVVAAVGLAEDDDGRARGGGRCVFGRGDDLAANRGIADPRASIGVVIELMCKASEP